MKKEFTLVTDGSDDGVGSILAQEEEGILKPVAFFHHTLTKPQRRYHTTDKELLAVILAIKRFRIYLSHRFNLITDHGALRFLKTLNMDDERGRRGRWIEYLQQFEINPILRSGRSKKMSVADYLSRIKLNGSLENVESDKKNGRRKW